MQCESPDDHHGTIDLEATLLHPVLPPNPNFFCCYGRYHITAVAKTLSIVYIFIYAVICALIWYAGISVTVMFALLLAISVGSCNVYGTFKWSKLCLVPFFLLQAILFFNILILVFFLFYAVCTENDLYRRLAEDIQPLIPYGPKIWLCALIYGLFLFQLFLAYSSKLMWRAYAFIAEVDRYLKSIKRSSSNASKDGKDGETQFNGSHRVPKDF